MMKIVMFAMLLAEAALGADPKVEGPTFSVMTMTIRGGILGMVIALSCVRPKDFTAFCQEIAGNLCCAIAFGGIAAPWVATRTGFEANEYLYVAVSAVLGISGLSIVKAAKSDFVDYVLRQMGIKKPKDDGQ